MHSWAAQGASAPLLPASPADSIRVGADASLWLVYHCWGRPSLAPPWRSWSEFAPTWCSFWSFVCLQSHVPPDSSLSFLTLSSALRISRLRSVLRKSPWMLHHHLLGWCLVNLQGSVISITRPPFTSWSFSSSPSSCVENSPTPFPESGVAPMRPQVQLLRFQVRSDTQSWPSLLQMLEGGQFSLSHTVPATHMRVLPPVLESSTLSSFLCHNFCQQTSYLWINQWLLLNPFTLWNMDIVSQLKEATGVLLLASLAPSVPSEASAVHLDWLSSSCRLRPLTRALCR